MAMFKIKRDDMVVVTAGDHKGRTGRVLSILTSTDAVLIEQVNMVRRHVKPRGDTPGGTIEKEAPIHVSNVALWDAEQKQAVKVGRKTLDDGRKVRFNKKTGAVID